MRKWQKERWLNFVYLIGYIYILHFSWNWNSLPGHFFYPFLLSTSHKIQENKLLCRILFLQHDKKDYTGSFIVSPSTVVKTLRLILLLIHCGALPVALLLFLIEWVMEKKNQLFHHVSEIFLIICQEWEVENRSGSRRKKSLSCWGFFSETRNVINHNVLRWGLYCFSSQIYGLFVCMS